jgi:putative FmdB family regulatory protein
MPLYEYECTKCGHAFEMVQKAGAHGPKKCPKCEGPVRKLLSAPAIRFKGSGWYITDYARKAPGGADKPSEKKGEAGASAASGDAAKKGDAPSKP